ncbi:MAG: flippase-like domain-containing protein [Clostridia bacterium]|nr:flippase-like domain-containing protein [Clostridia bacterium]
MEDNFTPIVNKIEFDEKTAEPVIVQIPANKLPEKPVEEKVVEDNFSAKAYGRQLVMSQVLGLPTNDKKTTKTQRILKRVMVFSFVAIILAVLGMTFYHDFLSPSASNNPPKWSEILLTIKTNWFYLLLAIATLGLCFLSKGFKLSVLCRSATGKWRFKTCFETGIVGHYYNYVTPLAVGGQPFEIYHLSKHGVDSSVVSSLPITAFFMYQLAFVILGIFSLVVFTPATNLLNTPLELVDSTMASIARPAAIFGLITCMLMPTLVVTFFILPKISAGVITFVLKVGGKLKLVKDVKTTTHKILKAVMGNANSIKKFATNPLIFIIAFVISLIEVLSLCSIAYFTLKFFGFANPNANRLLEWAQIVSVCMVLYAAISFIPTPGNSGAADASFYTLFKVGLVSVAGLSFPAMLVWRLLSFYSFIIIGFVFTTLKRKSDRRKEKLGIPLYRE